LPPKSPPAAHLAERERTLHSLFVRGQTGDASAYNTCLQGLAGYLRSYFRKKLQRIPDEIEDLVQETLIAIHNQRHTYDPGQPFTAWAYAIARYKLIDRYRQFTRHDGHNDTLDDFHAETIGQEDNAHEARRDIGKLLDTLPEKQRAPIQLVKLEGLSIIEASARTGQSESAVKVNIHRGLKALAARIQGDGAKAIS
jgi:RNA polymerase sigma-70 factor, ECF subfamily